MAKASTHLRNVGPMQAVARCGAKTRAGTPCLAPCIAGAARCRMHGGKGSGAPKGNRNAFKHGCFTGVILAQSAEARHLLQQADLLQHRLYERRAANGEIADTTD